MGRPIRNSEALPAVKLGIVVGVRENRAHGKGPEGEGGETVQRYPTNAQADHGECAVELAKWKFPVNAPLS